MKQLRSFHKYFLAKQLEPNPPFPWLEKHLIAFIFSVLLSAEFPRPSPLRPGNAKYQSPVMQEGIKAICSMLFSSLDKPSGGKPMRSKESVVTLTRGFSQRSRCN